MQKFSSNGAEMHRIFNKYDLCDFKMKWYHLQVEGNNPTNFESNNYMCYQIVVLK